MNKIFISFLFIFLISTQAIAARQESVGGQAVSEVTEKTFQAEVLDSKIPVLVFYWAEWCGPCRMVNPILLQLAEEFGGKLKVVKVNIDNEPTLAFDQHIASIPITQVYTKGKLAASLTGAVKKEELLAKLKPYLS